MKIKQHIELQRLIGKIDNDFNLSESDWIPRVAAWVTDALSQLKVLPMEKKRRTLEVSERLAQFPCEINATDLHVYDIYGNEIANGADDKCNKGVTTTSTSSCGCSIQSHSSLRGGSNTEIAVIDDTNKDGINFMKVGTVVTPYNGRRFWVQGNTIELNFNTDSIQVETYETATYYDDYYDCYCPYIYDNGLLLEALAWYCLFKYLSRGSKHPVYDLKSQNPYTNPFAQWTLLKNKAKTSVLNDMSKGVDDGWNNFFYNSTFLPRS